MSCRVATLRRGREGETSYLLGKGCHQVEREMAGAEERERHIRNEKKTPSLPSSPLPPSKLQLHLWLLSLPDSVEWYMHTTMEVAMQRLFCYISVLITRAHHYQMCPHVELRNVSIRLKKRAMYLTWNTDGCSSW